jgi:hypothetical protein
MKRLSAIAIALLVLFVAAWGQHSESQQAGAAPAIEQVSFGVYWGDINCDNAINPVDALLILRFDAGLSVNQNSPCPSVNIWYKVSWPSPTQHPVNWTYFLDVNCSGGVDPTDSMAIQLWDAGLPYAESCNDNSPWGPIGRYVTVTDAAV